MIKGYIAVVGGPEGTAKELGPAMKKALQRAVKFWHHRMAPRHFKPNATGRYGYKFRAESTKHKKRRIQHHQDPLVWTGDSKRQLLRMARVSGTRHTARVRMRGPKYWYMFRKDIRQPNKAEELTTTVDAEVQTMAKLVKRAVVRELNRARGDVRTVRI